MEVLSSPRAAISASIRERAERTSDPVTARYHADVIDGLTGDTVGEGLYNLQQERAGLLASRHRNLGAGMGLFGAGMVGAVLHANKVIGDWAPLAMLGVVGLGGYFVVKGGLTGDKITRVDHREAVISHWCQQLRNEGGSTDPALVQKLGHSERSQAPSKAELVELLESVSRSLAGKPGPQAQVQKDLELIRKAPGETLDSMRALADARAEKLGNRSMALFGVGAVNMLALMVTAKLAPAVGIVNSVALAGFFSAGVVVQDRRDQQYLLRDTLNRWELQLAELKDIGQLTSSPPGAPGMEVRQGAVVVGGVRVPVKVPSQSKQPPVAMEGRTP